MKTVTINKAVSTKWLTKELQAAGVRVQTVAQNKGETIGYIEIEEADEALALPVIEAHDPASTPDIHERNDLAAFYNKIENELVWLETARGQVATGKGVVDNPGSNLAQVKQVVSGLLDVVDRLLVEQREELKSWKYVTRRLK